jgi:hypothetical protein
MSLPSLIIAGLTIPHLSILELQQEYGVVDSRAEHRMGDGALEVQENWSKRTTQLTGRGLMPAAFNSIDWNSDVIIQCIALEALQSASNVIGLPIERRDDTEVLGFALVGNREVPTAVDVVDDEATLTVVSGADFYLVKYYPVMTCRARKPTRSLDFANASYGWSLEAQEV